MTYVNVLECLLLLCRVRFCSQNFMVLGKKKELPPCWKLPGTCSLITHSFLWVLPAIRTNMLTANITSKELSGAVFNCFISTTCITQLFLRKSCGCLSFLSKLDAFSSDLKIERQLSIYKPTADFIIMSQAIRDKWPCYLYVCRSYLTLTLTK